MAGENLSLTLLNVRPLDKQHPTAKRYHAKVCPIKHEYISIYETDKQIHMFSVFFTLGRRHESLSSLKTRRSFGSQLRVLPNVSKTGHSTPAWVIHRVSCLQKWLANNKYLQEQTPQSVPNPLCLPFDMFVLKLCVTVPAFQMTWQPPSAHLRCPGTLPFCYQPRSSGGPAFVLFLILSLERSHALIWVDSSFKSWISICDYI